MGFKFWGCCILLVMALNLLCEAHAVHPVCTDTKLRTMANRCIRSSKTSDRDKNSGQSSGSRRIPFSFDEDDEAEVMEILTNGISLIDQWVQHPITSRRKKAVSLWRRTPKGRHDPERMANEVEPPFSMEVVEKDEDGRLWKWLMAEAEKEGKGRRIHRTIYRKVYECCISGCDGFCEG